MNLPNKLTLARILMIPLIIIVSLIPFFNKIILYGDVSLGNEITLENLVILIIFCIASFTDFLDGYIARKNNLVTDFGKFMDPLADKILVLAALILLLERGKFEVFGLSLGFVVTLILAREFLVTGIRLIAVSKNMVIAASNLGKSKTLSQMFMIIVMLINGYPFTFFGSLAQSLAIFGLILVAGFLTLVSGLDYFIKNKELILKNK